MIEFLKDKKKLALCLILMLATVLRLWSLNFSDPYTDEVLLGIRAMGMVDYDASDLQTTPWQWVEDVPGWMHLSFHDHPVLFFLFQHFSMKIFGENIFAVRLPAALFGIGAVFLIYLLTEKLLDKKAALVAALLLALQSYHVYISRLGLQDGPVIFFSLLILWLWILAQEKKELKWYLFWGAALGLGIINKYTVLIIVPICLSYSLFFRYKFYSEKNFWLGSLATIVFSAPSWIYNLKLYQTFGHFDFQISALLNQYVPQWTFRLGRIMTGGPSDRVRFFFEVLTQANSIFFNLAIGLAVLCTIYFLFKKRSKMLYFLSTSMFLEILWFLIIGSTFRFVIMVIPYFILLMVFVFSRLAENERYKKIIYFAAIVFIVGEFLFSVNTFLFKRPFGVTNFTYAPINAETQNFGFNQVDHYLGSVLKNKVSAAFGKPEYQFLVDLHNKTIDEAKVKKYESYPVIIVYDKNFNFLSSLWIFQRHLMYRGWPVMSDKAFYDITGDDWENYYRKQGIKDFYYFTGKEGVYFNVSSIYLPYKPKLELTPFEKHLRDEGVKPEYIKNELGEETFKVYKF